MNRKKLEELPDTYVIFICDFDPVGLGKYRYTICRTLKEDDSYDYNDGTHTVFLSTKGTNDGEVPDSLVKFLKYVGARLEDSEKDYDDSLVNCLQETVRKVKSDREMGARYMLFEEKQNILLKKAASISCIEEFEEELNKLTASE